MSKLIPRNTEVGESKSEKSHFDPEGSLQKFAQRLSKSKTLKDGSISFRLGGPGGGDYFLDCSAGCVQLCEGNSPTAPLIEVIVDASRIQAILDGTKDARRQFFVGRFRVRGDLRYLSDLALELGIIDSPL